MPDLPSENDILTLLKDCGVPMSKREIVKAFGIKGDARRNFKHTLRKMTENGQIIKQPGQVYTVPQGLPAVCTAEVFEIDIDGDIFARPTDWDDDILGAAPRIEIIPDMKKGHPALKERDRILVRVKRYSDDLYEGHVLRKLDDPRGRVIGIVRQQRGTYVLQPTHRKAKYDFEIAQQDLGGASDGDLCLGEMQSARGLKRKKVRIIEVLGQEGDTHVISLIALHEAGLQDHFPQNVIDASEKLKPFSATPKDMKGREDLRMLPLVTIDGADARDFDDAVFAEETEDGFHLIVAIADVAHYIRENAPIDVEAYKRGNSTYFPDRVVPMLPERLCNDLCSLRPHEDRPVLAFHLWIDKNGNLKRHKIIRGVIHSAARLIYEDVQAAYDGAPNAQIKPLMESVITPLYAAYHALEKERQRRGALDLDLPERQIMIDETTGKMIGVQNRTRMDAHKLIESFMILANVAAAETLEKKNAPCVYRIHDLPAHDKLDSAREFLDGLGLSIPKGQTIQPRQLNVLLDKAKKLPSSHLISEVILRTQSQAIYSAENIGHFGLALKKYAHFTSPIRRYADLLVHRSLIRAYGLGAGGLSESEGAIIAEKAEHISATERISISAERSAIDRFTAGWLSSRIGEEFSGRINGVTRFGLFVTLDENGADGLVPIRTLPDDFYVHDEAAHALIGRRSGRIYRLGASVKIRIYEANALTGSSVFELVGECGVEKGKPLASFPRSKRGSTHRGRGNGSGKQKFSGKKQFKKKGPKKR